MRKYFIFSILTGLLISQVRVGEMKSITSSLDVRSLIASGDEIILATGGGLAVYHLNSRDYKVYTKDHGLVDTDLKTVHKGPKGYIWIGSESGVQIWNLEEENLLDWFQLGIEEVSGFVTYKDLIYGAIKQAGVWGTMEFIHANDKVYYRDFYGRDDIGQINDIVKFGEDIILSTDQGLLSGNPHKTHPIYWTNPFPEIETPVIAIDQKDGELALVTSEAIYSVKLNDNPVLLVTNETAFSTIQSIAVRGSLDYMAVTDSAIYQIGTDQFEKQFSDTGFRFSEINTNNSISIIGTSLGFVTFDGSTLSHIAGNEPIVSSPQAISITSADQLIMAGEKGISLKQHFSWFNGSNELLNTEFGSNPHLVNNRFDMGNIISDIIRKNDMVYIGLSQSKSGGIWGTGLEDGGVVVDIISYPKLIPDSSGTDSVYIILGIAGDKNDNLWAISTNTAKKPLSVINGDQYRHFSINESGSVLSSESRSITIDNFNRVWIGSPSGLVMYKYSGNVFNPTDEVWHPEDVDPDGIKRSVLDINVSTKNRLWILTNIGLVHKDLQVSETNPVNQTGPTATNGELYPYFPNVVFNQSSRIKFDPRGNVWVTSPTDGVHIVTENGEYWPDINGLNESKSTLLSNHVNDVTFDTDEGLAYIATKKGVSVVKIPYAEENKTYNSVTIFPSPFRIPSSKPMTVDGLKDNSSLKIMTLNGEVLRTIENSEVQGYQAFWDGRDASGKFVGTGVYLIAVYDKKGSSSYEKVAVIRE